MALFAQAAAPAGNGAGGGNGAAGGNAAGGAGAGGNGAGGGGIPLPIIAVVLILGLGYVMIFLPERKRQKAFRDQLASLKKNDRVVTIGGIYGVVSNIQREADKITVKVDDQTKIDFTLGAISRVIPAEGTADADKSASK